MTDQSLINIHRLSITKEELCAHIYPYLMTAEELRGRDPQPHRRIPGTDLETVLQISVAGCRGIPAGDLAGLLEQEPDELLDRACRNQQQVPYTLAPLSALLGSDPWTAPLVLLLSNQDMMLGSGEILHPGAMAAAAGLLGGRILVIPSSKHEVLLMSEPEVEPLMVRTVVRTINSSIVSPEDRLSDQVYLYEADSGCFSICEEGTVLRSL